jgi:hypothetical protein
MRIFSATFLACLVLFNWAESCVFCFSYTEQLEARYEMNMEEARLASKLRNQLLDHATVRLLDKPFTGHYGAPYTSDFVFSDTDEQGEVKQYLVYSDAYASHVLRHEVTADSAIPGQASDIPAPQSLQDFFATYLIATTALPVLERPNEHPALGATFTFFHSQLALSGDVPPPEWAPLA